MKKSAKVTRKAATKKETKPKSPAKAKAKGIVVASHLKLIP